jgi:hypothetical protein
MQVVLCEWDARLRVICSTRSEGWCDDIRKTRVCVCCSTMARNADSFDGRGRKRRGCVVLGDMIGGHLRVVPQASVSDESHLTILV